MPLTQESCLVGKVSYHDSFGPEVDAAAVQRDLGVHNKVMLLRNGGALCCGETVEEAFFYAKNLVQACEAQVGGTWDDGQLLSYRGGETITRYYTWITGLSRNPCTRYMCI